MSESAQFWWNWWVQLGVAVGTIAAALVALFGAALRAKFFPPLLRLDLLRQEGDKIPVRINPPASTGAPFRMEDARFFHLIVKNKRRWSPAHDVQIYLTRVETRDVTDRWAVEWLGDLPMRWRHQEISPLTRTVGPDAECDMMSVVKGKHIELSTLITPYNLQFRRSGPTQFVATFEARSSEVNSRQVRIMVTWDGDWHDGDLEMKHHLFVAEYQPDVESIKRFNAEH